MALLGVSTCICRLSSDISHREGFHKNSGCWGSRSFMTAATGTEEIKVLPGIRFVFRSLSDILATLLQLTHSSSVPSILSLALKPIQILRQLQTGLLLTPFCIILLHSIILFLYAHRDANTRALWSLMEREGPAGNCAGPPWQPPDKWPSTVHISTHLKLISLQEVALISRED